MENNRAYLGRETQIYQFGARIYSRTSSSCCLGDVGDVRKDWLLGKYVFEKMRGCLQLNINAFVPYDLKRDASKQVVCDTLILPMEYQCPFNDVTGKLKKIENTISIHWFSKSAAWKVKFARPLYRIFGINLFRKNR